MCTNIIRQENEDTFNIIFDYLSSKYSFKPRKFMCHFNITQIKSFKTNFQNFEIV